MSEWIQFADERIEKRFRATIAMMRELGVVSAFGIMLGPEPRTPTKIEKLGRENTPEARRQLRIETAREELRARMGDWDIPDAKIDMLIDPAVFEQ